MLESTTVKMQMEKMQGSRAMLEDGERSPRVFPKKKKKWIVAV